MNNHLLDNGIGDAILEMNHGNGKRRLFVFRHILSEISPFFKACNVLSKLKYDHKVFDLKWNEGGRKCIEGGICDGHSVSKQVKWTREQLTPERQYCLPIIELVDFDFHTIRNLVYFAYTGHVNLQPNEKRAEETSCYKEVEAFSLYKAAHMYGIKTLEHRCFVYLCATCTTSNILSRLLNPEIEDYEDLEKCYIEFLKSRARGR